MEDLVTAIGASVCLAGGGIIALALVIGFCLLVNRASYALLDCYGGMKTFMQYRKWYQQQKAEGKDHA
jgi:hypothetical protein